MVYKKPIQYMYWGTANTTDVPSAGKHHYLGVKDIEDVITKHRAEVIFARAESQTSYATLNATIVYRAKINDI